MPIPQVRGLDKERHAAADRAVTAARLEVLEKANHELRWQVAMLTRAEAADDGRGGLVGAISAAGAVLLCVAAAATAGVRLRMRLCVSVYVTGCWALGVPFVA